MDLGLHMSGAENTKKILTSALSFLMVSIHNNNTSMLDDIMKDLEKDINDAIESNSKSMKDIRNIHYKMIMLISTNRSIQKIIPIKEKRNESITLQLDLWKKTTEKIEYLFRLLLNKAPESTPLSEFLLGDLLRFFKNYIAIVDIKNDNAPLIKISEPSDKIEEEKLPDQAIGEIEESIPEELDTEVIKMEISEGIREEDESKIIKPSGTPFERFGLKLISQIFLGESENKEFEKNPTKDKLLMEIKKKSESDHPRAGDSWLVQCLTHSSNKIAHLSQSIAKEILSPRTMPLMFDIYYRALSNIFNKDTKNDIIFKSLRDFASSNFKKDNQNNTKFLRKVVNSLFVLVEKQLLKLEKTYAAHLSESSSLLIVSLNTGLEIEEILDVVRTMLKNNDVLLSSLKNDKDSLQHVLKSFLFIRKFTNIKNHNILECENLLGEMFESLKPDTEDDKKAYLSECIGALLYYKGDIVCETFLYEQILNIISPSKQKKDFQIQLAKYPQHEEYIKGQLNRAPYKASDIGTTMSDVRNRMCKELELGDPNPYELLVAGNLVDLDLPIHLVFEKVWAAPIRQREAETRQSIGDIPPMKVILRIAGLEGEATENRISGLTDDSEGEEATKQRVKLAEVFKNDFVVPGGFDLKVNGVELLIKKIKDLSLVTVQRLLLKKVVKLLVYCSKVQENRATIIKLKGVPILLELLLHLFPISEPNEEDSIIENILAILENVLKESAKDPNDSMEIEHEIEIESSGDLKNNVKNVEMCLGRISHDSASPSHSKLISSLTKILPFLTGNQEDACRVLIEFFTPYLKFSTITADPKQSNDAVREYYIKRFIEMTEMLPAYFNVFRGILAEEKLIEMIITFIQELCPDVKSPNIRTLEDNQKNLSYSMRIILGLINGDPNVQSLLKSSGILDLVYKLADPKIKLKDVGKYCEEIIEYLLSSNSVVDEETQRYVKDLKQAELAEKKRKALQAREEAMKKMGFVKKAETQMVEESKSKEMEIESTGPSSNAQFDLRQDIKNKFAMTDLTEEKVLVCISCQEGYINKPDQILGIYTYTKKLRIPEREAWLRGEQVGPTINGFNTVTHFNCIHLHCHNAATKADKNAKKPKNEWEGAIIRNSHTGCNGWFPIKGPNITDRTYEEGLSKFYSTLSSLGSYDQDFTWLHICDLSILLTKFAKYDTFSKETKGGAAEHNLMFVPFYIQLIGHLMKQKPEKANNYQQKIESVLAGYNKNQPIIQNATFEDFMILLTVSLLYGDNDLWNERLKLAVFYYMLSVGTQQLKLSKGQPEHQIKTKIHLSSESEARHEEKLEKYLDEILPLIIGMKLITELMGRIHSKCIKTTNARDLDKGFLLILEQYITKNYIEVLASCEEVTKAYKEDFLQIKYFENFVQDMNLLTIVNQEHGSLENLIRTYIQ